MIGWLAWLLLATTNPSAMAEPPPATADASDATPVWPARIPERFRGEWNQNLAWCGTGIGHARFRLDADRIRFYESGGPVLAVVTRGTSDLAVIADMAGEGNQWLGLMQFRLSADGACLTEVNAAYDAPVRCRCPSDLATTPGTTQEALP